MIPAILLAAALLAAPPAGRDPNARARDCLFLSASSGTSYHPVDDHTIVIESDGAWYELVVTPTPLMLQPQSFFVNEVHSPSTLCSPLDFQLSVAQPPGVREGLIVQSFRRITADEAKALRPRFAR